ncbi:MAG: ABC transporter ATP-binding protein [Clostridia bacterium]|nr:ABC transporter ATP-binding protein [Clostridia bacterium]
MILELKDVTFSYNTKWNKVDVLKGVNCAFERGKVYGIIGKSGSGKSTVMSLMAGITLPQGGQVIHEGTPTSQMNLQEYRRDKVSVIYQSFRLLPLLTTVENVMYPLELRGMKRKEAEEKAETFLADVGIPEGAWHRFPVTLSGGEQQRVAIARALACDTHLLLADEPTGNLDAENSEKIIDLLKQLAYKRDFCVVIVTHDVEVMDKLDVVYRMIGGKLVLVEKNAPSGVDGAPGEDGAQKA